MSAVPGAAEPGLRKSASSVSQHSLRSVSQSLSLFHEAFGRESSLPLVTSGDEEREIAVWFCHVSLLHCIPGGIYFTGPK